MLKRLLEHRRMKQMELAIEHDPVACECLREHIKQVDDDISRHIASTPDDEPTQKVPLATMYELVYGTEGK